MFQIHQIPNRDWNYQVNLQRIYLVRSKFIKSLIGIETCPSEITVDLVWFQIHQIPNRDWNSNYDGEPVYGDGSKFIKSLIGIETSVTQPQYRWHQVPNSSNP